MSSSHVQPSSAKLLARQWRKPDVTGEEIMPREFHLCQDSATFRNYYDDVQQQLKSMAGMDEFLAGTANRQDE